MTKRTHPREKTLLLPLANRRGLDANISSACLKRCNLNALPKKTMQVNGVIFSVADYVPYERPECRFPVEYQGEWLLFEKERRDTVKISPGEMTFSHLGHFVCKSKHWAVHQYKLLSVFRNGW